jgi:hypothetical protein
MKKVAILFLALTISTLSFAQTITIDVFEIQEYYISDSVSVDDAILQSKIISQKIPVRYTYVLDFNLKICKVYTGTALISSSSFIIVSKKGTDFAITLDGWSNEIGIYVNGEIAAFYERFRSTDVSLFTSFDIH